MQSRVESTTRRLIEDGLQLSKYDVAGSVFCHHRTAQRILKKLHEEGVCKIARWTKSGQLWIPVYSKGTKRDKKMPPPLTAAEKSKRFKDRHPDYVWSYRMHKRAERLIKKVKSGKVRDPQQEWVRQGTIRQSGERT